MSEERKKSKRDKIEKKQRKEKTGSKKENNKTDKKKSKKAEAAFSLLADEKAANPALAALFAAQPPPTRPPPQAERQRNVRPAKEVESEEAVAEDANDAELSSIDSEDGAEVEEGSIESEDVPSSPAPEPPQRRKRKHDGEEVEDVYMRKLAREEAKDAEAAASERAEKRQRVSGDLEEVEGEDGEDGDPEVSGSEDADGKEDEGADVTVEEAGASPPPKHETQMDAPDVELSKANRTVFLGNVSTAAISSKTSRKQLVDHLKSFFKSVTKAKDDEMKFALESIRFRSTPYATAVPKKAAFATKQLMDATAKCTNAYAVYSHPQLAREAAKQLNATVVLDRHLRVDEVAHPSKVDHRRCVFVGNLGFVDDETNINQANADDGREMRKPGKEPADIDEGLWRIFGRCGKVESVRVVRDSTTRVGKGIAYVQFEDANAVEAALLYNEKKFPPMLPRKLRVSRSKAPKRNAKPGSGRPNATPRPTNGYRRKVTGEEASRMGRAGKLYGRAAAAQVKRQGGGGGEGAGMPAKRPEDFVFEGHRASSKGGKAGLKLGGKGKGKKSKPAGRSAKRGAAFKAASKKAK